jgi:NTE family protein
VLIRQGYLIYYLKRLIEEDKRQGDTDNQYDHDSKPLLFDIIAGTSIGAMNGAVLVGPYLKTGSWETAAEELEQFWTDNEKGLASTLSEEDLRKVGWGNWLDQSNNGTPDIASNEAARRYYSVKYYVTYGAPKVYETLNEDPRKKDSRFFDSPPFNDWLIHNPEPLKCAILTFAQCKKIATSYENNEPRFLVFSVDAAEGKTVTFDSYPIPRNSMISDYNKYGKEKKVEYNDMITDINSNDHDGVSIDQVMASAAVPEFYDYKEIDGRKFWDGGWLSNTPFRELLQAHQEYWVDVISKTKKDKNSHIPDLEVYIVNLHPAKRKVLPTDHDGVKDRQSDIINGDRSSRYDEKMAYLVADLKDFATQLRKLSCEAISKVSKESDKKKMREKFDNILAIRTTTTASKSFNDGEPSSKYDNLLNGQYKLSKVVRIERTERTNDYYADTISGKGGDFSAKTICGLIEEGKRDATDASL